MVFYDNRKKLMDFPGKIFKVILKKISCKGTLQKKKFLQAIGGWKKIRAQKNCPTPPPPPPPLKYLMVRP
jgi:hypothetical protein